MKCRDARAAISARFDGEHMGVDGAALAAHLASCPACRVEADAVGLAGELLSTVAAPEPSASFDERVLVRLNRRGWFDRLLDWFEVPVRRVAVMLACSALLTACVFLVLENTQSVRMESLILERQAGQMGLDPSEINLVPTTPSQRSEGGTIKCA